MSTLYIARHGQDEDNAEGILNGHRDRPLTAFGRQQAQELAEGIKELGISFSAIYSSPLSRALETAHIVAEKLGMKVQTEPNLIERDFGSVTGEPVADIERLCAPDIIKTKTITYFLSPDGAETFPMLIVRAKLLLEHMKATHDDQPVLLVTHGDFGKMIYAAYYNLAWRQILTQFHFGNSELLILDSDSSADQSHVLHIEQHNH